MPINILKNNMNIGNINLYMYIYLQLTRVYLHLQARPKTYKAEITVQMVQMLLFEMFIVQWPWIKKKSREHQPSKER